MRFRLDDYENFKDEYRFDGNTSWLASLREHGYPSTNQLFNPNVLTELFEMDDIKLGSRHIGLIAQEVEGVIPEIISENEEGIKAVAYANMT